MRYRLLVLAAICLWLSWFYRPPVPTVLSFRIGQTFEEVVASSSYPVLERSNHPGDDPGTGKHGATWVTEPAVIIRFNDPRHGFTLPPTKFAALGFDHNVATTLATSPMLEKLPFDEAVEVLEQIQNQLKAGGWQPWDVDRSEWFDLSVEGKKRLHAAMFEHPYHQEQTLRIPKKFGMIFRFMCAEGCWTREPPYRFLIDIGVSSDVEGSEPGDPPVWDKSHPVHRTEGDVPPGTRSRSAKP